MSAPKWEICAVCQGKGRVMTGRGGFLILLTVLICCQVWATDFYVATDGNDSSAGTLTAPFATIQKAVDTVFAGDTVYIRGGSYHEEVVADALSGDANNPITFINYNDEIVTLDGSESLADLGGPIWTVHDENIYKTTISKDIWQLWVDGRMAIVARWPNHTLGHPCDPIELKADGMTAADGSWWDIDTWGTMASPWNAGGNLTNAPAYHNLAAENVSFAGGSIILNFHSESQFSRPITSHSAGSNDLVHVPVMNPHDKGSGHFLIEHKNALDRPGEWYYDPNTSEVWLWCEDGQTPQGRDIRGKTISYALTMDSCEYITVRGINFFGCTINSTNGFHVTIEDCTFSYPTWFRRMLGEHGYQGEPTKASTQPPEVGATNFLGDKNGTYYTIRNCIFEYSDGMIYMKTGLGNLVENCLFHHFSFTGMAQMVMMANSNKDSLHRRNTFHTNGSKVMVKHSHCDIEWCRTSYFGYFQMDGCAWQCAGGSGAGGGSDGRVRQYLWNHNALKPSVRWDGNDGINGTDHHIVSLKTYGSLNIKGDWHKVISNTCIVSDDPQNTLVRIRDVAKSDPLPRNQNTDTYNIVSDMISTEGYGYAPIPGNNSNNWNGPDHLDPGDEAIKQVRDADNLDFRPAHDSDLIDAGIIYAPFTDGFLGAAPDIGAYEYGDPNYWIPGRQEEKACTPIPPDGSTTVKTDADLMWLGGRNAISHNVYLGTSSGSLVLRSSQTNNIFDPGNLTLGQTYHWRIDTVTSGGTVIGDEWSFTPEQNATTAWVLFNPLEDVGVKSGSPGTNYKGDQLGNIRHSLTEGIYHEVYLKFDVDVPGDIVSANLQLTRIDTSGCTAEVWSMSDNSWDEDTVTWNTRPDTTGILLDTKSIAYLVWPSFDVSSAVTGNGVLSLRVDKVPHDSNRKICLTESGYIPRLNVEYRIGGPIDDPPAAPTNLAGADGLGLISLDWDDNTEPDLAGYRLYRRQNPEDNFAQIHPGLLTTSDYIDTSMLMDLEYQYVVKAEDAIAQLSFNSNMVSATAADSNPPDINDDGKINYEDFAIISLHFGEECTPPGWCQGADLNISGWVDPNDIRALTQGWVGLP